MRERYVQLLWINRRNGGNCVLMTEEEYSSIMGTLYLCRNPAVAARLEHSLALAEQGEFVENAKTTC